MRRTHWRVTFLLVRLLWRFFTGKHLDGKERSNATIISKGTWAKPHYWGTGKESRWALMPGYQRAAVRWFCIGVPAGLAIDPVATTWALSLITGPLAGVYVVLGIRAFNDFTHHKTKTEPLGAALADVLDIPLSEIRNRVKVPYDYGTNPDAAIVLHPPVGFTASDRAREDVLRAVTTKLGIEAPEADWRGLAGSKPMIALTKSVPPPSLVTSRDILPAIENAAEHELVLGIGKKDQVTDLSLDTEVPHVGFCMTTGDGKSTAAMNAAAQILHHGGLVVFLDWKLMSHMWARGLPNVAYAGTPAELHAMLAWLAYDQMDEDGNIIKFSELGRRKQVSLAAADIRGNVAADIGPRILIVGEELNVMQVILKRYWRRTGGKGPSPAAEAFEEIHHCGRQLRMHAIDIGQRLSARATSASGNNADARENLGAIVFSNPSASTWKMLCDGKVQPPATDHKGRYQLVTRKQVREFQGARWDEEDARAYATSGVIAEPRFDMPFVTRRVPAVVGHEHSALLGPSDQVFVPGHPPVVPLQPSAVTLREAAEAGLFRSVEAARKAAQRHGFRVVGERDRANLYDLSDLHAHIARRTR